MLIIFITYLSSRKIFEIMIREKDKEEISESEKIGQYSFDVMPFNCDCAGRIALPVLGVELLNCARKHAGEHGFDHTYPNPEHLTWVLSRLVVEFDRIPRMDEHITLRTWVRRVYRNFCDREYEIIDNKGTLIGKVFSVWALLDYETRRSAGFGSSGTLEKMAIGREVGTEAPRRVRVKAEKPSAFHEVVYSDLDLNGHTNSMKYLEFFLNLFSPEMYTSRIPARIEVQYTHESRYGSRLDFFKDYKGDGEYHIEAKTDDGRSVSKGVVIFK